MNGKFHGMIEATAPNGVGSVKHILSFPRTSAPMNWPWILSANPAGQQLGIPLDDLCDLVNIVTSLRAREASPRLIFKCLNRSRDSGIDVLLTGCVHRSDLLTGGRIDGVDGGIGFHPFVVYEQAQWLFNGFAVWCGDLLE
ncbi:hypothetical protein OGATHE_006701 [Ogataea polymorpha]|uniref:Uncharacterized protein n=1 Tax=Ogataea polymorpha TaxID=460523 RepID=A0A9P8NSW4_9ASCO|nr:hypothetical protein OGATHE_006701 [Ogataea polymorpha]